MHLDNAEYKEHDSAPAYRELASLHLINYLFKVKLEQTLRQL